MPRTVREGRFYFVDDIEIDGAGASHFVIGPAWMIELVELASGSMTFISDNREVAPKAGRFGVYYAPFSIVSLVIDPLKGKVEGFGAVQTVAELPKLPMLFYPCSAAAYDLKALIDAAKDGKPIPQNSRPSLTSLRAKRIIDQNYVDHLSIADVASKIGVSHEHMTRQFRKDFDLAPLEYLHKIRMAAANLELAQGKEIVDVSADVGYNDLGRFYKQFRKAFSTTPGSCK